MKYYSLEYSSSSDLGGRDVNDYAFVFDSPDILDAGFVAKYTRYLDDDEAEDWLEYIDRNQAYETPTGLGWKNDDDPSDIVEVFGVATTPKEALAAFQEAMESLLKEVQAGNIHPSYGSEVQSAFQSFQSPNWVSIQPDPAYPSVPPQPSPPPPPPPPRPSVTSQFWGIRGYMSHSKFHIARYSYLAYDIDDAAAGLNWYPSNIKSSMLMMHNVNQSIYKESLEDVNDGLVYSGLQGRGWVSKRKGGSVFSAAKFQYEASIAFELAGDVFFGDMKTLKRQLQSAIIDKDW